ncbi:photosystem reaction center subunit H [Knoellia sinensis KCTC 19936]|uniref:Photosystem reaction center subunit H n=1 Tax=Knoellia sinensis KCTC 19936 TaxID=1385520 RepID=A0A0A0J6I6_9MICO|nr:PRC and DUF2382 domain-containing protein [Knoellia sinensis]KGN32950.1 photosystem reaction center subunit H [Knoellia sinensis KCTC 19936]
MITMEQVHDLLSREGSVVGNDGSKIGSVTQIYLDDQTDRPEWATVKTGWFGATEAFVPLAEADLAGEDLKVPFDKDTIKDAPQVETHDGHLTQEDEAELYRHYGMDYSESRSDTGLPAGGAPGREGAGTSPTDGTARRDTSGTTTDDAMTRSEERLNVGTERRESGKARLRKYVVTENVTKTVPVSREEVRVEREPITDANRDKAMAGNDITDAEHEVTLHEERPTVEKEAVPVERVRMNTEKVTDQEPVSEEVRKEKIEAETPQSQSGAEGQTKPRTGQHRKSDQG